MYSEKCRSVEPFCLATMNFVTYVIELFPLSVGVCGKQELFYKPDFWACVVFVLLQSHMSWKVFRKTELGYFCWILPLQLQEPDS